MFHPLQQTTIVVDRSTIWSDPWVMRRGEKLNKIDWIWFFVQNFELHKIQDVPPPI